jgi:hypothetical protein
MGFIIFTPVFQYSNLFSWHLVGKDQFSEPTI